MQTARKRLNFVRKVMVCFFIANSYFDCPSCLIIEIGCNAVRSGSDNYTIQKIYLLTDYNKGQEQITSL